mmetsp:Transcript_27795/g.70917  ORF Transcript_27795/g.70917 Transcript_27795/m.70917 type:complete len:426 (-) Transcript_27795:380-1657(-)
MPTGAPLLPVTKVGPGDKQKAYVVRQNLCLKIMLGVLVCVGFLSSALLLQTYEVRVQRRASIHEAREHREEEHTSHMRVLRLSMLLQRHLEDEVHDLSVLTTYRAWLMRAVGDYQNKVVAQASTANCTSNVTGELQSLGMTFDADIDRLLERLWKEVVTEGKTAQKSLHNITRAIVSELRQDATEQGAYEHLMEEAGESAGRIGFHERHAEGEAHSHHGHGHHMWHDGDPEHEGQQHGENPYPAEPDGDDYPRDGDHHHGGGAYDGNDDENDDDDEEHLAGALEALLERLQAKDAVLHVDNVTLQSWEELQESSERALSDDEQEVDMERIGMRIVRAVNASDALVPAYNETVFGSQIDWLGVLIHRAKLAPYRDELTSLLGKWQAGDVRISAALSRIEELIDADVLEPDVLVVHGDYEHYAYHDD